MKTLVLADRSPDIPLEKLLEDDYELIILAGDLMLQQVLPLQDVDTPKIGVYGNHCAKGYFDIIGVEDIHGKLYTLPDGRTIYGLEGCPRYKPTFKEGIDTQYEDYEVARILLDAPGANIFLSHSPPFSINDAPDPAHLGWRSLKSHLERKPADILIHGHTYPREPLTQWNETRIEYVSGHKIITL